MEIGFIGLGRIGIAIARNLAGAGHRLRIWNRSPVAPDAIPGGKVVADAADAFDADVVFTMLSDDAAIRDVVLGPDLLARARPGLMHVVSATISVKFADELAAAHGRRGLSFVSAPVFGRPDVAEAAKLNVMIAGAGDAVHARMAEAVSAGFDDKDWSIMADYTLHHAQSIDPAQGRT